GDGVLAMEDAVDAITISLRPRRRDALWPCGPLSGRSTADPDPAGARGADRASSRAQFLLKSKDRIASLPRGSFRNLWWHEGQRSNRKPLCSGAARSSERRASSRWRI